MTRDPRTDPRPGDECTVWFCSEDRRILLQRRRIAALWGNLTGDWSLWNETFIQRGPDE